MTLIKSALLALALPLLAGAASAASLTLAGTGYGITKTIGGTGASFSLVTPTYTGLTGGVGDVGDRLYILSGTVKTASNGLSMSAPARVRLTYLGSEAGFTNTSVNLLTAATIFSNKVNSVGNVVQAVFPAGLLAFAYRSGNGSGIANNGAAFNTNLADIGIAFSDLFNGGKSVLVFFDDNGAGPDRDFDDLAMRVDVASVPAPAAGLLLVGALGGLGAAARRRHAAA